MSDFGDDVFDAVSDYADKAAKELADDPLGFVAKVTGAPDVSIDTDDSDGTLGFKYKSTLTDIDAKWEEGKGSSVTGQAGADLGPAPLFKSKMTTDAEGNVTEMNVLAKATIPIEGVLATGEVQTGFVQTDDGFKANYSTTAGAQVSGVTFKGGTHGSYEDHGDRGFNVSVGPHGAVGLGAGEIAEGFDAAEGEAKISNDLSYGELDGQTSYGVKQTSELEGKVLGQTLGNAKVETGAMYTTGPNGEQIIVDQRFSGQIGNEHTGLVSGTTGTSWTVGVDGEGNEIDRLTSTDEGKIAAPGEQPITVSSSNTQDDATGIHDLLDTIDQGLAPEQPYQPYVLGEDSPPEQQYQPYALGEDSPPEQQYQPYALGEDSPPEQQYAMGESAYTEQQYAMGESSYTEQQYTRDEDSAPEQQYAMGESSYTEQLYTRDEDSAPEQQYAMGESSYSEPLVEQVTEPSALYGEAVIEDVETYEIPYEEPSAEISETVVEEVETYEIPYEEPSAEISETVVEEVETYEIPYEEPSVEISETVVEEVETYEIPYEEPAVPYSEPVVEAVETYETTYEEPAYEEPAPADGGGDGLELEY